MGEKGLARERGKEGYRGKARAWVTDRQGCMGGGGKQAGKVGRWIIIMVNQPHGLHILTLTSDGVR